MDDFILSAIGSVGFPIVACIALFYLYDKTIRSLNETLGKINTTLERLVSEFEEHRGRMENDTSL